MCVIPGINSILNIITQGKEKLLREVIFITMLLRVFNFIWLESNFASCFWSTISVGIEILYTSVNTRIIYMYLRVMQFSGIPYWVAIAHRILLTE